MARPWAVDPADVPGAGELLERLTRQGPPHDPSAAPRRRHPRRPAHPRRARRSHVRAHADLRRRAEVRHRLSRGPSLGATSRTSGELLARAPGIGQAVRIMIVASRPMRYRILGPILLGEAGDRLPAGGSNQIALLACLLLNPNRGVTSDRLLAALWGDDHVASKRLQMTVTRLRRGLEPFGGGSALRTIPGGYVLVVAPGELDAEVFERRIDEGCAALGVRRPCCSGRDPARRPGALARRAAGRRRLHGVRSGGDQTARGA